MPSDLDSGSADYCQDQVRQFDHDRYLTVLFAEADARPDLFALYAFNLEVAKTAEVVTEPMLGQIRLQWWRDAIGEIYEGTPRRHEVIEPLAKTIKSKGLDRALFDRLIDAREQDLLDTAPPHIAALTDYAEATGGCLAQLAEQILGGPGSPAAAAAGRAYALAGLARAIPLHASRRQTFLPTSLVTDVAVDMGDLFELRPHLALAKAVEQLCGLIATGLGEIGPMPGRRQRPALLCATLARLYLKSLKRAGFDPFDDKVQRPHAGRTWALLWASMRGVV